MAKKRVTLVDNFKEILDRGNLTELEEVFKKCDINAKTSRGIGFSNALSLYPLKTEVAFWLKEQGINLNFRNHYERTPIFYHVRDFRRGGNPNLLIELGCDIHVVDMYGENLLHLAVLDRNIEMINYLLDNGFDINLTNSIFPGRSPEYTYIEKFLEHNHSISSPVYIIKTCKLLLERGAKITLKSQLYIKDMSDLFDLRRNNFNLDFIEKNTIALSELNQIFSVSDITIPSNSFTNIC